MTTQPIRYNAEGLAVLVEEVTKTLPTPKIITVVSELKCDRTSRYVEMDVTTEVTER